jgi:phosphopantetheinyl transferase
MDVYWLEQTESDVPAGSDWLSANERLCLSGLRFPKRRDSWRLGRWTAKRALIAYLDVQPDPWIMAKIEVRPAPSGAPEVFLDGKEAALTISLSHQAGLAVCAIAPTRIELGCDLEAIEPRSQSFIADYFTRVEQERVSRTKPANQNPLVALLWSAKESALKALHQGLRLDPRSVIVNLGEGPYDRSDWSPLRVHHDEGQVFQGWWRCGDRAVRTVVADPAPDMPISLELSASAGETVRYA